MTLAEFTRVEAENVIPVMNVILIILASKEGFGNYCDGCSELVLVQETDSIDFPLRVFCKAGKCSNDSPKKC